MRGIIEQRPGVLIRELLAHKDVAMFSNPADGPIGRDFAQFVKRVVYFSLKKRGDDDFAGIQIVVGSKAAGNLLANKASAAQDKKTFATGHLRTSQNNGQNGLCSLYQDKRWKLLVSRKG